MSGQFGNLTLSSVFQPIFDIRKGYLAGYEALLRARDDHEHSVAPPDVFRRASSHGHWMNLERNVQFMHASNFARISGRTDRLFLNTEPEGFLVSERYQAVVDRTLQSLQIRPERVVLEVLERPSADIKRLAEGISLFREKGFGIALDDFGAGHSNVDRVWQLQPDIVKVDRTIVTQAAQSPRMGRLFPKLISMLRDTGSRVVVEGVETEQEARLALESGAEFAQGYYFARPMAGPFDSSDFMSDLQRLRRGLGPGVESWAELWADLLGHLSPPG